MITATSDASHNNTSKEEENLNPNFVLIAQDIQNQGSPTIGAAPTEARHFQEFFEMSMRVVKIPWDLLLRVNLHPEKSH
jgi:hypothetical protein